MNQDQDEMLNFVGILNGRIAELEAEVERQNQALISQQSLLLSLQRQRKMITEMEIDNSGNELPEWIHVNECALYPELPQPSTVREWIRKGFIKEKQHFKRMGRRNKIYVQPLLLKEINAKPRKKKLA